MRLTEKAAKKLQSRLYYDQSTEKLDEMLGKGMTYEEVAREEIEDTYELVTENNYGRPNFWDNLDNEAPNKRNNQFLGWLIGRNRNGASNLAERLTVFWLNHFVTVYSTSDVDDEKILIDYYIMARKHCLGDLKEFVRAVSKAPAMLVYLDGDVSEKDSPNENFAREVMELFTLGEGNGYGQEEVEIAAKAFTGYRYDKKTREFYFSEVDHDSSEKTFMEVTGNLNGDDIIDILFEKRRDEIAAHITSKFFHWFGTSNPSEEELARIAKVFEESDFEIATLCYEVFCSEYVKEGLGCQVKDPYQAISEAIHTYNVFPYTHNNEAYREFLLAGHVPFFYLDVSGHKTNDYWLNGAWYLERMNTLDKFIRAGADKVILDPENQLF